MWTLLADRSSGRLSVPRPRRSARENVSLAASRTGGRPPSSTLFIATSTTTAPSFTIASVTTNSGLRPAAATKMSASFVTAPMEVVFE